MKFTKEIKIALVSILGIVVLFFGMQFLKGLSLFGNDNSYYVAFVDATGLSQSAPVYANGYRVGVVKSLEYDYSPQGKITAVVGLDKQMRLPRGSRAELASDLLGNIKVNLVHAHFVRIQGLCFLGSQGAAFSLGLVNDLL